MMLMQIRYGLMKWHFARLDWLILAEYFHYDVVASCLEISLLKFYEI